MGEQQKDDPLPASAQKAGLKPSDPNATTAHQTPPPSVARNPAGEAAPDSSSEPVASTPAEGGEPPKPAYGALIIDDDEAFAAALREYLALKAVEATVLKSEEELKAWLPGELKPVLAVVSVNLGGIDIRDQIVALRDAGKLEQCALVAVSPLQDDDASARFNKKLGFAVTVSKPVRFEVLDRFLMVARQPRTTLVMKKVTEKTFEERRSKKLKEIGLGQKETEEAGAEPQAGEAQPEPSKQEQAVPASSQGAWVRAALFGSVASALTAGLLALHPWGYGYNFVILEGLLLGVVAGLAMGAGLKNFSGPASLGPLMVTGVATALVSNAVLLGVRLLRDAPILKPATRRVVRDLFPGEASASISPEMASTLDTDKIIAGVYIAGILLISAALAIYIAGRRLSAMQTGASRTG